MLTKILVNKQTPKGKNMVYDNCQLCGKILDTMFNYEFDAIYGACHSTCLEERED